MSAQPPRKITQDAQRSSSFYELIGYFANAIGFVVITIIAFPLWHKTSDFFKSMFLALNGGRDMLAGFLTFILAVVLTITVFIVVKIAVQTTLTVGMQKILFFSLFGKSGAEKKL